MFISKKSVSRDAPCSKMKWTCVKWTYLTQNIRQRWAIVNKIMKIRISWDPKISYLVKKYRLLKKDFLPLNWLRNKGDT